MSEDAVQKLESDVSAFSQKHKAELKAILSGSDKLLAACSNIEQAWSGSFAGWHGRMYYRDFQKPDLRQRFSGEWGSINGIPEGWVEKDTPALTKQIDKLVGGKFSVIAFEAKVKMFRAALDDLRSEVGVSLSLLDLETMPKERQLADQIETFLFGKTKNDYVKDHLPTTLMTRDMEALRQGICIPGHLYYEAVAYEGKTTAERFEEYMKLISRLLKQFQMRMVSQPSNDTPGTLYGLHPDVISKCSGLYKPGSYAEAVEKSFKIVRDKLRTLTGYETGSDAFGRGKLHIKGAAAPNVDDDFNAAAKFLMMAIDMFRNEKGHTSDAKIEDPIRAHQYLSMSSLALSLLENAEIKP
jgi:uncharacterized protein (TIGR02391 family)